MMMGGRGGRGPRGQPPGAKKPGKAETGGTLIKPSETAVTLVPHVSRNWIIVVAPADMMEQIRTWVEDLDKPREVEKDYELYDVQYASVNDVAQQITQVVQNMPPELRETTHVVPFPQSKKLIVFGSKAGREIVMDLLDKLDIEDAEKRIWKKFQLKNADAEELAERIETLFSAMSVDYSYDYGYSRYTRSRRDPEAASVTVVPDKRLNTITVLTDRNTMEKIAEMIQTEDVPVDPDEVRPMVYDLKYVDAAEMQTLLSEMFGARERRQRSYMEILFGGGGGDEAKPVGRLLGHFTFQVVGGSNRLIVNSKSGGNYEVIDRLIKQLDTAQKAGLPLLVDLKYANAEDLCEQLNAMLAEPSTIATIRRAARGLAHYQQPTDSSDQGARNQGPNPNPNQPPRDDPGEMVFWWQSFRRPQGQMPASNLGGKIRIVPVYRRNALMVLAPEGYKEPLRELIEELDQPGQQVMIRARIGEIQHEDQTTLGLRIASDPSIFPPADTAIAGSATAGYAESFMSGTLVIGGSASVSALLHLLVKEFGLKILLEPTITTSDNMASEYFDGQDVPVQTEGRTSAEGGATVTEIEYREVGTRLRVRPHITQTGSVDLMINLEISRIVPGQTALGNFIFDRREVTTHVIVEGGQTIMLSGLIRQEHFDDIRKVPLLGDLWLIGKLFRSVDKGIRNREMVVFITPYVMKTTEEIDEQMEAPKKTLERIEQGMKGMIGTYRPDTPGEATP